MPNEKVPALSADSPLADESPAGSMFLVHEFDMTSVNFPLKCPVLRQSDQLSMSIGQKKYKLLVDTSIVTKSPEVATDSAAVVKDCEP